MEDKGMFVSSNDVENALSKLMFYLNASLNYVPYKSIYPDLEEMLSITTEWLKYYIKNNNLLEMTDEEVDRMYELQEKVPNDIFNMGTFYDNVDAWLATVIYYGSCPIGIEFSQDSIVKKGSNKSKY